MAETKRNLQSKPAKDALARKKAIGVSQAQGKKIKQSETFNYGKQIALTRENKVVLRKIARKFKATRMRVKKDLSRKAYKRQTILEKFVKIKN